MTLNEYITALQNLLKDNPKAGEYTVICAGDDEGNSFNEVVYTPSAGIWEEREWMSREELEDWDVSELNAVCVN